MANIWIDKHIQNNENSQYVKIKSQKNVPSINRSAKKQVFGELKNVMHNQSNATPFKGNAAKIDGLPVGVFNTKTLCTEVLRKQQMKQNIAEAEKKFNKIHKSTAKVSKPEDTGLVFDEEMFDSWDRNRECCQKKQQSDMEIWSEMYMLDTNFADCKIENECEQIDDCDFFKEKEFDDHVPMPMVDIMSSDYDIPNLPSFEFEFIDELPF